MNTGRVHPLKTITRWVRSAIVRTKFKSLKKLYKRMNANCQKNKAAVLLEFEGCSMNKGVMLLHLFSTMEMCRNSETNIS